MYRNQKNQGHIYLELIILAVLSSGVYLFWKASQESTSLIRNEDRACEVLDAIAQAQNQFRVKIGESQEARFGTLDELMGLSGTEADYFDIGTPLRRLLETSHRQESIFADEHYCYLVYLVDDAGFALARIADDVVIQDDFWIAYAWPRQYGPSGRRVFVIDSHGVLRSWDNQMNGSPTFAGTGQRPPAHLAPAPEEFAYPMTKKPQGTQRVNKWLLE